MKLAVALSVGLFVAGSRAAVAAAPEPPVDGEVDELGLTPDDYVASIDYDTTYDDSVAQAYDDGYSEDAHESFRDTLAPYGTWVDDPAYGQVWVPSSSVVGRDFSPYATNGDWVDTEYGWTWVSGWSWGWAPFHYGRWTTIEGRGWGWIPGTMWGPAWVAWRAGSGCVAWAPLPPRGVALGSPLGAHSPWRFVGASSFGRSHDAYLPPSIVPRVFGRMSVVSNARRLGAGRETVTVNVGPTLRGRPAAGAEIARLASVAPSALPRIAVRPRAGMAIEGRSWAPVPAAPAAPAWRSSAPRFTAPTAPFTAPMVPFTAPMTGFTAPTTGFTGSSPPSSTGAWPGYGGGNSRALGGGPPSFRGGGGHRR